MTLNLLQSQHRVGPNIQVIKVGLLACGSRASLWIKLYLPDSSPKHVYPEDVCFLGTGAVFTYSNTKKRKREKEQVNSYCIFKITSHISVLLYTFENECILQKMIV